MVDIVNEAGILRDTGQSSYSSEYSSEELRVMDPGMIGAGADAIREAVDGRHVAPEPLAPPKLFGRVA